MDDIRGIYGDRDTVSGTDTYRAAESDAAMEPPPLIGQDERRMQVRAYNHWAGLLNDRSFPSIEDLQPESIPDFGPYSVLLDFTGGIENPGITYLGDKLALECETDSSITRLADVPARSLLSRITDHYMQILANQAPIGFEAEFTNNSGKALMYRGILLPFSSDDDNIDFIYGVINWKEAADQKVQNALEAELERDAEAAMADVPLRTADPATNWADGPAVDAAANAILADQPYELSADREVGDEAGWDSDEAVDLPDADDDRAGFELLAADLPAPDFGNHSPVAPPEALVDDADADADTLDLASATMLDDEAFEAALPVASETDGLADQLAIAREVAQQALGSEDRTRAALYQAVSRAYDFALAADANPEDYAEILEDAGMAVQDRAPMTPIVKLVFGVDYDKTRLTEYATVLGHARRIGLERGSLGAYLARQPGGVKSLVADERKLRRGEQAVGSPKVEPKAALVKRLRNAEAVDFESIEATGHEFALLMVRRTASGEIELLGEVPHDVALIEKAARKLVG